MKLKRILAAALSLCVVVAMAGCGDKTDSGKKSGDLSSADVDAATFEGLTFKTNPDLDFGGKTVTVARDTAPKEGVSALYDRELAIKAAMGMTAAVLYRALGRRHWALPVCGIAAEVIGTPAHSIGEAMYLSKVYMMTAELFAWTLVVIGLSILFEKSVLALLRKAGG